MRRLPPIALVLLAACSSGTRAPPSPAEREPERKCSVGHRAGLAASILARRGFKHVINDLGGYRAWQGRSKW